MAEPIGTGKIKLFGRTYGNLDIYPYHDPETNTNYRSIFISELPVDRKPNELPNMVTVMYRGNSYKARKYGNPNNNIPTYDFTVENKADR